VKIYFSLLVFAKTVLFSIVFYVFLSLFLKPIENLASIANCQILYFLTVKAIPIILPAFEKIYHDFVAKSTIFLLTTSILGLNGHCQKVEVLTVPLPVIFIIVIFSFHLIEFSANNYAK